jgi:tetratricopeptide (TPR) repeat protein
MLMNRMPSSCIDRLFHADLLHPARRVWKLRLGSCRLSRLEEEIFHEPRDHDLPGSEVPERFFQYLKTGNFTLLDDVLDHNRQDIASLAKLLYRLMAVYEKPEQQSFLEDIFSVGRALEKQGEVSLARKCYHLCAGGSVGVQAQLNLGQSFRRLRETDEAIAAYQRMIASREGGLVPHIELAKLYEHQKRDVKKALEITRTALLLASEPMLLGKNAMQETQNALQYRYMRLMRKVQRISSTKEAR